MRALARERERVRESERGGWLERVYLRRRVLRIGGSSIADMSHLSWRNGDARGNTEAHRGAGSGTARGSIVRDDDRLSFLPHLPVGKELHFVRLVPVTHGSDSMLCGDNHALDTS